MKILNLSTNISSCKECPNIQYAAKGHRAPVICGDTGDSLGDINLIPSWCTLLDCTCTDGTCSGCIEHIDEERQLGNAASEEEYFKRLEQEERGKS